MKPHLDFERLLRVPYVEPETGFDLSPDGSLAAFSWNETGQWEIYILDLHSDHPARQLTTGAGAKFHPRFSPNGRYLIYLLDMDGGENFDICLCSLENSRQINLMPDTPETIQNRLAWSPAGDRIAFISNRSGRFSTYIQQLDTAKMALQGEAQLAFDEDGPHSDLAWSPDGRCLAVVTDSRLQEHAVFLVPIQPDGNPMPAKVMPLRQAGAQMNVHWIDWSPDSTQLVISGSIEGYYQIGLFDLQTQETRWLTTGKGDKIKPSWSPLGSQLTYVLSDGPQTWLAVQSLDGSDPELFQVESGQHYSPLFTPDGQKIVFIFESPRRPDDLWMLEINRNSLRQLTNSLPEDLSPDDFVIPTHITYPSYDGSDVPALLYLPPRETMPSEGLPPAVIIIHGGPNWLFPYLWYPIMSHMASRGWVVLAPNYRGSTGYGLSWQLANLFEIGRGDTMDVAAGADFLANNAIADPNRIALTGRSHGGYLTMSCLTEYPKKWAGGSAIVPFLNWFTSHAASRLDLQHWDRETMGDPVEYADLWRERSPYFHLHQIEAPVQMIGGANDERCPASEIRAARQALLEMGKSVDCVIYEDEGHTFLKIENVVEHELRRVDFLRFALEKEQGDNGAAAQFSN